MKILFKKKSIERNGYQLFLTCLIFMTLFTCFLLTQYLQKMTREMVQNIPVTNRSAILEMEKMLIIGPVPCIWWIYHGTGMQTSWNVTLLEDMGLRVTMTTDHHTLVKAIHSDDEAAKDTCDECQNSDFWIGLPLRQSCPETLKHIQSQVIFHRNLQNLNGNPSKFCDILRRITQRKSACFLLPDHLDEFVNLEENRNMNTTWQLFVNEKKPFRKQITTLQIFQTIRRKMFTSNKSALLFRTNKIHGSAGHSWMTIRLYFLLDSLFPLQLQLYNEAIVIDQFSDKEDEYRLLTDFHEMDTETVYAVQKSATRMLYTFLENLLDDIHSEERNHLNTFNRISQILMVDFSIDSLQGDINMLQIYDHVFPYQSPLKRINGMDILVSKLFQDSINYLSWKRHFNESYELEKLFNFQTDTMQFSSLIRNQLSKWNFIENIQFQPNIHLKPNFRNDWTEYTAIVPYSLMYFQIDITVNQHVLNMTLIN